MNEETRLFNPEIEDQNNETVNPDTPQAPEKKGLSTRTIVAGVAGGGVVGAAAAAGAAYAYDNFNGDDAVAVVEEGEASAEAAPVAQAAPVQEVHTHTETVHVVHDVPVEEPVVTHPVQDGPVGSNHIGGGHTPSGGGEVITAGGDGPVTGGEESDVHVIGIDVVDNGQGGEAVIAYMEDRADGQLAAVIDVEGDGTVDVLAVDENGNQHFEENEFHDVSGEGIQTIGYIESYAMEQGLMTEGENGSMMAGQDDPDYTNDDQDYYTAMDDTTPDYVNDADTGLYEA